MLRSPSTAVLPLVLAAACVAPALADPPDPVELEQFESTIGRYPDLTTDAFFDAHAVAPANTETLPFDVSAAQFYDTVVERMSLSKDATDRLTHDGLVLVDGSRRYSMAAAYWEIFTSDLPLLVTTDSVLDAVHRSFGTILAEMEENVLAPTMMDAIDEARRRVADIARHTPALAEAAADVDLYLTVARNLLVIDPDGKPVIDRALGDPAEVAVIMKKVAALRLENPGMGGGGTDIYGSVRAVDWSQFKPRGHYTKTPRLQRYFRMMMWLGRADTGFELAKPRQMRAAALLAHVFDSSGALDGLKQVKDVVDLMVGRSDELTPFQLVGALEHLELDPAALADAKNLERLRAHLAVTGMGQQRIRSQLVVSHPDTLDKAPLPTLFQLFGQRFVVDSFILSKVVYDDIFFEGHKMNRRMPMGLDVMAALGNDAALRLLRPELERWKYSANLATLRDVVASYDEARWNDTLYTLWLDALRTLNTPPQTGFVPAVMQREAWARKTLQTQLASWAQLRHDTILYAKQSYTASIGCLYPKGYVEPYPAFYDKLATFARLASIRFAVLGTGNAEPYVKRYVAWFDRFAGHMDTLGGMARTQLAGQPFDAEQVAFLEQTIERKMVGGYDPTPQWNGWYMDLIYLAQGDTTEDAAEWEPTIADVHTDPDAQTVLHVGTGDTQFAVVAIDNDGDTAVHVGPVFSYYEFAEGGAKRLTDAEWQTRLRQQKAPARPAWITPHVVSGRAR